MIDRIPPEVSLRIGGERRQQGGGGTYEHISPVTGAVDATIPLAGPDDVDAAVSAARMAFTQWRRTSPAQRARILLRLADLVEEHGEEFSRLNALDNGTPVMMTAINGQFAADWIRYYAGWADKPHSEVLGSFTESSEFSFTLAQPYGVIAVIITWNAPLVSLAMKVPAALAAGNTVVVKPSEMTPFCAGLFADLAEQAGLPPGVLNIITGAAEAGAALVAHHNVEKVTFTGGSQAATRILQLCAETVKPVVLELGGKSANIILDDADLDAACMHGAFMSIGVFSGQGCALPTRMLVHDDVYDAVIDRLLVNIGGMVVGDPFEASTLSGPVVNEAALHRVLGMIDRANADGATLLTGGHRLGGDLARGFFISPTIFTDVDPQSELGQEEVFGPVLAVTRFGSDDEAITIANGTRYGLSGYVQSRDLRRALAIAEELISGEVLINGAVNANVRRPFGGVGASGLGKEGGRQGIEEFLRIKSIAIA